MSLRVACINVNGKYGSRSAFVIPALLQCGFIIARKEKKKPTFCLNFHEQCEKHKATPSKFGLQWNEGPLRRPGHYSKKHVCWLERSWNPNLRLCASYYWRTLLISSLLIHFTSYNISQVQSLWHCCTCSKCSLVFPATKFYSSDLDWVRPQEWFWPPAELIPETKRYSLCLCKYNSAHKR